MATVRVFPATWARRARLAASEGGPGSWSVDDTGGRRRGTRQTGSPPVDPARAATSLDGMTFTTEVVEALGASPECFKQLLGAVADGDCRDKRW